MKLIGGLFGMGSDTPPTIVQAPAPKPTAPMPDPEAQREAERRAQRDALSRGGRSSTILSTKESRGTGSDSYSATKLGTE